MANENPLADLMQRLGLGPVPPPNSLADALAASNNSFGPAATDIGGMPVEGVALGPGISRLAQSLATLPQRAAQSSEQLRTTGEYDPGPAVEAAMMTMGGTGFGAPRGALGAGPAGIRAYHGSPYDFDRFDMSKIGTGEGAQSYGHGLYFAEHPETAQAYRDAVTQAQNPIDRQSRRFLNTSDEGAPGQFIPSGTDISQLPRIGEERASISNAELIKRAEDNLASVQNAKGPLGQQAKDRAQFTLDWLRNNPDARFVGAPYEGRMYEVNIKADPEQFLDWDKPFSEQSPGVQNAIRSMPNYEKHSDYIESGTMGELYKRGLLPNSFAPEQASSSLSKVGIPGIKYLDQGSRGAGQGTSNYVVFDDSLIEIMRKYGLAGLLAANAARYGKDQASQ